jgi:hypothetical protein
VSRKGVTPGIAPTAVPGVYGSLPARLVLALTIHKYLSMPLWIVHILPSVSFVGWWSVPECGNLW